MGGAIEQSPRSRRRDCSRQRGSRRRSAGGMRVIACRRMQSATRRGGSPIEWWSSGGVERPTPPSVRVLLDREGLGGNGRAVEQDVDLVVALRPTGSVDQMELGDLVAGGRHRCVLGADLLPGVDVRPAGGEGGAGGCAFSLHRGVESVL